MLPGKCSSSSGVQSPRRGTICPTTNPYPFHSVGMMVIVSVSVFRIARSGLRNGNPASVLYE